MKNKYLEIGKIVKPFGIKGELKIISESDEIENRLYPNKQLYIGANYQKIEITSVRYHQGNPLITINNINDINQVLPFINQSLYINIDEEEPLDTDEFYYDDLIDMVCKNTLGEIIGIVTDIIELPHGEILEIKGNDNKRILIPFVNEYIEDVTESEIIIKEIEGFR